MDFRDRAHFEAERYGADPWIFVRELLQNARDAGATAVAFRISVQNDFVRLSCRDNGGGMTEEHAKQFLFRLYASSKEGETGAAGRFGVGFWSILRFEPVGILIRSWPKKAPAWQVALDGKLENAASAVPAAAESGTEIVLTRRYVHGVDVAEQVRLAAHAHARYLMTRGKKAEPLEIQVDGTWITEALDLPAPSATFQHRAVRGVVALGATPKVELFSKGLHVRSAASADELLASPDDKRGRKLDPLLEGLAPQIILDGDELDLVRSRSDARDDRALRRAVDLAQRELARLIERQLQFSRPVPLWRRWARPVAAVAVLLVAVAGVVFATSGLIAVRARPPRTVPATRAAEVPRARPIAPYRDLAESYRGPRTDTLPPRGDAIDLSYVPTSRTLHFAAFHLHRIEAVASASIGIPFPHPPFSGHEGLAAVSLNLKPERGWVRLPVPTGYAIDTNSVKWNGVSRRLYINEAGEALVFADSDDEARVSYRVAVGTPPVERAYTGGTFPQRIPDDALQIRDWVARRVKYSNDPVVQVQHRYLAELGLGFVERTLKVGAGDCDVQNGVLAAALQASGYQARLTIGYVGRGGTADALLHAWVEYRVDSAEPWRVLDASQVSAPPPVVAGLTQRLEPPRMPSLQARTEEPERFEDTPPPPPGPSTRSERPAARRPITIDAWRAPPLALGFAGAAPGLVLLYLVLRPRTRRQTQLDEKHDVSLLLQGALARPEAFMHVPALFEQPLVPRRGGGLISLGEAYELASKQRLYSSDIGAPYTERAVRAGAVVIDAMRPEGRVVAEALGAVNLDRWDRLLRDTTIPGLLEQANAHLRARGERWALMFSRQVSHEPAVLSVPGTKDDRWVVVNGDSSWFEHALKVAPSRPAQALFDVVDQAALWLRLSSSRRARLLAPLARAAMLEELGTKSL